MENILLFRFFAFSLQTINEQVFLFYQ